MDTVLIVALAVAAVVVVVIIALVVAANRRRHRSNLRSQFGGEYDRLADERGDRDAERELDARRERVARYDLRPVPAERRDEFLQRWHDVRSEFVDQPADAVVHADALLIEIMRVRGYEGVDSGDERRADDLSAIDADGSMEYRDARAVSRKAQDGSATTEELRGAMQRYDRVFDSMLQVS